MPKVGCPLVFEGLQLSFLKVRYWLSALSQPFLGLLGDKLEKLLAVTEKVARCLCKLRILDLHFPESISILCGHHLPFLKTSGPVNSVGGDRR